MVRLIFSVISPRSVLKENLPDLLVYVMHPSVDIIIYFHVW